jgi:DNA-binding phage protein
MNKNEFDMEKIDALPVFDPADHLSSDSAIVAFLTDFVGEENPVLLRAAIENVARALAQRTTK